MRFDYVILALALIVGVVYVAYFSMINVTGLATKLDVKIEGRSGNAICDLNESYLSCPKDCKCVENETKTNKTKTNEMKTEIKISFCGDGFCNDDETCSSCPKDCGSCGISTSPGSNQSSSPSNGSQPQAYCGDGFCNDDENCSSCPQDCKCVDSIVYVSSPSIVNENFIVNITINVTQEVYGFQFDLYFDKNILEAMKVEEGDFLKDNTYPITTINNTLGKITFANTKVGVEHGVKGIGNLARIYFNVKTNGTSILDLDNVKVVSKDITEIQVIVKDGNVTVK